MQSSRSSGKYRVDCAADVLTWWFVVFHHTGSKH